jgi:hypothetical protein
MTSGTMFYLVRIHLGTEGAHEDGPPLPNQPPPTSLGGLLQLSNHAETPQIQK